jgi:predicted aspartyl protease
MRLQLRDNLPFVSINVKHQGKNIRIKNTLVDTGSGGTILAQMYYPKSELFHKQMTLCI